MLPTSLYLQPIFSFAYCLAQGGFPSGSVVKNLPAMQEMQEMSVRSLGLEDPLEKEMAIHSSILAWRIPQTEKLGELWSIVLEKVPFGKTPVKASMIIYQASNYRDGALGSESVTCSAVSDCL